MTIWDVLRLALLDLPSFWGFAIIAIVAVILPRILHWLDPIKSVRKQETARLIACYATLGAVLRGYIRGPRVY